MAANFYERFKNKDLMNLFKRLCTQNQQRKFDALWGIIDDMSAELLKKGVKFVWDDKCDQAFQTLRKLLTSV